MASTDEFQDALAKAARTSTLTAPGAKPFHLKLSAADTCGNSSEFKAELELWWVAPDKWRRELKSPVFTQTAVQDGTRYSETNSSDYLPFWLHELIQDPSLKATMQREFTPMIIKGVASPGYATLRFDF